MTAPQTCARELNIGNRQITGVAAGAAAGDAVNVEQLQAVDGRIGAVDKLAVKYDDDGAGNALNSIRLTGCVGQYHQRGCRHRNGDQPGCSERLATLALESGREQHLQNLSLYNDIQSIGSGGGSTKYFNVHSNKADSSATGTDSVAIGPAATAGGTDSVAMGNGTNASADNAVAVGAGSAADGANRVSVVSAENKRQITNVAAATETTDPANLGQMQSSVTAAQEGGVRYDSHGDGSVDHNNVSLGNGTGDTTIHNVAGGVSNTDAVNVNQFKNGMRQAVDWANAYTDERFGALNSRVEKMGNRANAGVASAMAMSGLPQAYAPGKSMAAVAGSILRDESSLAIGISTVSKGGRWVYRLTGSSDSRGDAGVTVGAGIQWWWRWLGKLFFARTRWQS